MGRVHQIRSFRNGACSFGNLSDSADKGYRYIDDISYQTCPSPRIIRVL